MSELGELRTLPRIGNSLLPQARSGCPIMEAMSVDILNRFSPAVRTWFQDVFAAPTPAQRAAWSSITSGEHALVVSPTGSGKTLAAFLWALNSLVVDAAQRSSAEAPAQETLALDVQQPGAETKVFGKQPRAAQKHGVKVLYISPLKALGVDVENNLRAPLAGIARTSQRLGLPTPKISVAVRSGDTPQAERSRQLRHPPDILITTPESLYLMLTSKAAGILRDVETVIIDEIHAIAGTKRGVHLALSLERLERQARGKVQRIGLSATVRPVEAVAHFLGGDRPVDIIAPPADKKWKLRVTVPVEDMSDLPIPEDFRAVGQSLNTAGDMILDDPLGITAGVGDGESALPQQGSIWPFIEAEIYHEIMRVRSTLVFVNSRRTAERLTSRLNELYAQDYAPEQLSPPLRRPPAQLMAASATAGAAPALIARAHHGSVSKDERAATERMLKEGTLKAVVATSSLELGIDMGAVDLVIQVESPPSAASGLQRVGRAGHVVGAISEGSFYPKHRQDLIQTTVTVARMQEGLIEELHVPRNPLDVLLQQTVAAVAVEDLNVEEWYATVRRSYPYRDLSRDVFDSVLDLASGVYPSTDFSELRPRITIDALSGTLSARPGAKQVAVTNAGTIPDRGMFGVFLVGSGEDSGLPTHQGARRVGELDEEMVYESRVGDIFTLGATSWRIEEITKDQVLVSPAPGHTGRLPFWTGAAQGRPYELGRAVGAFRRQVSADSEALGRFSGLNAHAKANIVRFLQEQAEATGVVPDESTLVLERFRDELGDWRVILHTPFGHGVNAAWALAVGARISETTGLDAQPVAGDDGIVLRLPDADETPGASLFLFDPEEVVELVTQQVGNSALFASRFRECAARALLLPRRNPGARAPLWQQRQRAAQLLDVARTYPKFPIILETVRECLQDVYDLPALKEVCRDLNQRRIRVTEVTTEQPSPFASSLLFNYTGAFMYEGDSPLAEKRAAALALDPALLAQLLGTVQLRDLLDSEIIEETDQLLRRVHPDRRAKTSEQLADTLRLTGPVPIAELERYCLFPNPLERVESELGQRVMRVRIAGREHLAQVQDAALLRDALGIPVPSGVAASPEVVTDALEQLILRFARSRGPFTLRDLTQAFGVGASAAYPVVHHQVQQGSLIEGQFRQGVDETEYVAGQVLTRIRSRSLAQARSQAQPVSHSAFARFLLDWQQVAPVGEVPSLRGVDGTFAVIEQLAGVRLPASAWESLVLPSRVADYKPEFLDELLLSGEIHLVGAGSAGARDPWIMLLPADYAAQLAPQPVEAPQLSALQESVLTVLSAGGSYLCADIAVGVAQQGGVVSPQENLREALWGLFELGLIAPESFRPLRARLSATGGKTAHRTQRRPQRSRLRIGRTSFAHSQSYGKPLSKTAGRSAADSAGAAGYATPGVAAHGVPADMLGRWSLAVHPATEPTARSIAHGEAWLDRYGVVTRGSIVAENVLGGFALAYKVLSRFEENGKALRGYFIDALGASQFSVPAVIDRLRDAADSLDLGGWASGRKDPECHLVAASDPANPYGAALPWPRVDGESLKLSRGAGALVILVDGLLVAHVSRGGRTLRLLCEELPESPEETIARVMFALSTAVSTGMMQPFIVEKINGTATLNSEYLQAFRDAGGRLHPRGIKITAARYPRIQHSRYSDSRSPYLAQGSAEMGPRNTSGKDVPHA